MKLKYWIIGWLMLPLLAACSETDDLDAIFMGRSWKLSRIMENKNTSALNPEEQKALSESAMNSFFIMFSGNNFSGKALNASFSGTWQVDGKKHTISFQLKKKDGSTTDVASQKMINLLENAIKYEGDTQQLSIIQQNGAYLLFYPLN